ncbi:MAG: hypothetical protein CMJ78_10685 [Planctomycetaceae bacterium]|nr:hypothetical protein [Planctomycetaceae bacterium]
MCELGNKDITTTCSTEIESVPMRRLTVGVACLIISITSVGLAQRPRLSPETIAQQIDFEFEQAWKAAKLAPSRRTSDSEFVRRVFLDIAGTIPPEDSVRKFLAGRSKSKREDTVKLLLDSPAYSKYSSVVWGNLLVGRGKGVKFLQQIPFRNWLEEQFAANRPFDEMVKELLTASGKAGDNPAVVWTIHHEGKAENLTGATARVFLGTQIQCAQCHDHPFESWKQTDFYGMAAFFGRVESKRRFLTVTVEESSRGEIRVGGGEDGPIAAPTFLDGSKPKAQDTPSRRQQLANWLVDDSNEQFPRAVSNRVWAHYFGRGLVDPVDDFGESNAPSLPAVLDLLAESFVKSGYDLKFLIKAITSTRAYHLSSLPSSNNQEDEEFFSRSLLRRLGPEQLLSSVVVSTGISSHKQIVDNPLFKLLIAVVQQQFVFVFSNMDEMTEVNEFNGTISQALLMMNSDPLARVTDWGFLDPLNRKLRSANNVEDKVEILFLSTLSRKPTRGERVRFGKYFNGVRTTKAQLEICEDIYWALLNSAEFAFNH